MMEKFSRSNNTTDSIPRETWGRLFSRLMRIVLTTVVSLSLIIGVFLTYDSKFWRYYQYQKKEGFYFEKYRTAEEAEKALLKIYPLGSEVSTFFLLANREGFGEPVGSMQNKSRRILIYFQNQDSFLFRKKWKVKVHINDNLIGISELNVMLNWADF